LLALGTAWLSARVGWSPGWRVGFVPFVPGALLKSVGVVAAIRWRDDLRASKTHR